MKRFILFLLPLLIFLFIFLIIREQTRPVIETPKSEIRKLPVAIKRKMFAPGEKIASTSASIDVPILMYHYVEYVTDKRDTIRQSLNVNPNVFEDQVKTLKNAGYTFLTAGELGGILDDKKKLVKKPILLTFDDGHNDLDTDILPILKKYNIHATAYIISGFIDRLDFLTTGELRDVIDSKLVEIGAHTVHHVSLAGKLQPIVKFEVEESKAMLEKNFNLKVVSFAYPDGAFDEQAIQVVKDAGFRTAVSTVTKERQSRQNRFFLYRLRVGYMSGNVLLNFLEREKLVH